MTEPPSPRRVPRSAVAGSVFLGIALVTWAWCAWTNWWLADLRERPVRELDAPIPIETGARSTIPFTPNAGIPHQLHLEFDAGFPEADGGVCPVAVEWTVTVGGDVVADGDAGLHTWRAGEPGMGIVRLGTFDARRDEEHAITTRVSKGLPGSSARLNAVRDDLFVGDAAITARALTNLAFAPLGVGLALLLFAWLSRRYRIQRRP